MDTREVPFDAACEFVIELGADAHAYGCSTPRLEAFLTSVMTSFGYGGVFRSTPNEILFAFRLADDQPQRIHLMTTPPGGLDLDKLARLGDLVEAVVSGRVSIDGASAGLAAIRDEQIPWGPVAIASSYAAVGAGIAGVLMGSWWDIAVATVLSLVVYGIVVLSGRRGGAASDWVPLTTAFVAGVLAVFVKQAVPELNLLLVVLSAIAVLLPGYSISQGVMELAGGHIVSGFVNLMSGLTFLLKQAVGGWIGVSIVAAAIHLPSAAVAAPPDVRWQWLFVPALCIGLCVVFQTGRRDFWWASLSCAIAYVGMLAGTAAVGANFGNLVGTIAAVLYSNEWAKRTGRPTSIVLVPAIILSVSGSIGFRGLAAFASGNAALGEAQVLHMFYVALTVGTGLLVGNTIYRPKVTL